MLELLLLDITTKLCERKISPELTPLYNFLWRALDENVHS